MTNPRKFGRGKMPRRRFRRQLGQPKAVSWQEQIRATYIPKVNCARLDAAEPQAIEENVWNGGLPDDVFCTILAFLPLSSFFRLRCVCKKWSRMAQDPIFLDACSRVPSREPALFLKGLNGGACWNFEPALNAWKCMPPSFFVPKDVEGTSSLVIAAGGRVLFSRSSPRDCLMVYNPLNNTKRTLPPMLDMSGSFGLPSAMEINVVGMYVDTVKEYFHVLVVDKLSNNEGADSCDSDSDDFELEPIASQVFDSRTGTWNMIGSFEPPYELRILNAALFAETLHCLTIAPQVSASQFSPTVVDELAVYRICSDEWEYDTEQIPTQDQALVAPHIFTTRGRQMLVAAVPVPCKGTRSEVFPKWKSIIIWELEMAHSVEDKWVKLLEIDLQDLNAFKVDLDNFVILSGEDVVYFGSTTGSALGMINVHEQSWRLLPSLPSYSSSAQADRRFQTFVYEPRFDVVA